ncbi:hypothetical protein FRC02_005227 [Tulasnella sp. 418]|nr:hypothetical protein FRC02_005227 [Tulasnella sp. 418]
MLNYEAESTLYRLTPALSSSSPTLCLLLGESPIRRCFHSTAVFLSGQLWSTLSDSTALGITQRVHDSVMWFKMQLGAMDCGGGGKEESSKRSQWYRVFNRSSGQGTDMSLK